jgi:hypothetical protein
MCRASVRKGFQNFYKCAVVSDILEGGEYSRTPRQTDVNEFQNLTLTQQQERYSDVYVCCFLIYRAIFRELFEIFRLKREKQTAIATTWTNSENQKPIHITIVLQYRFNKSLKNYSEVIFIRMLVILL